MKSRDKAFYREKVLGWIRRNGLIAPGSRVVCALSGGADSVAMLLLLCELGPALGAELCAAHVDHMLRGDESRRDAAFCEALCRRLDVPFTLLRGDARAKAGREGLGTEEAARKLRYELLAGLEADRIAVAHNADDNLETVLMRLVRGGGARGLSGIPPRTGRVVRPVMVLTREETEAVCRLWDEAFVTDSTNADEAFLRNRLRRRVVPELKAQAGAVPERVLENSLILRDEDEFLDRQAARALADNGGRLDRALLERTDRVLALRILRQTAAQAGAELDGAAARRLLETALSGRARFSVSLPGADFRGEYGALSFRAKAGSDEPFPASLLFPGGTRSVAFGEWRVSVGAAPAQEKNIYRIFNIFETTSATIQGALVVRAAESGDTFRRNAGSGRKPLRRIYSDRKLTLRERRQTPVLADGAGVLYVPGLGVNADRPAADGGEKVAIIFEKKRQSGQ